MPVSIKNNIGAVCLGTFDGVHLGHQAIIQEAKRLSRSIGKGVAVFTFFPHPSAYTGRGPISTINTREQRARLMSYYGADEVIEHPFSMDFAALSPRAFVEDILLKNFGRVYFVAGFNYTFGHKAGGNIDTLRALGEELGFGVSQVDPVNVDGSVVSSTRVRKHLLAGELSLAAKCLGRKFSLCGSVQPGDKRGRTLGFPTANVHFLTEQVLPPSGVYLLRSKLYGIGVGNLGIRPTFPQQGITLEAHFIEKLEREIYGEELELEMLEYLRPERAFESPDALRLQVSMDIEQAISIAKRL